MFSFSDQIFSKWQSGFHKGFIAEQCSMHMTENWWKYLDTRDHSSSRLVDLSKTFDCIDHQLLMAKLNAYGVDKDYTFEHLTLKKKETNNKDECFLQ